MIAGRAELEHAISLDPNYAPAQVCLGYMNAVDGGLTISGNVNAGGLSAAIQNIRRGIELAPTLALGHRALGVALFFVGQFDEALQAAERSAALGPGDADNIVFLGFALNNLRRYSDAIAQVERAIALNPSVPSYYSFHAAAPLYALGRYDESAKFATGCVEKSPGDTSGYLIGAAAEMALGRKGDAAARIARLLQQSPSFSMRSPISANLYSSDPPLRARFVTALRGAGLSDGSGA
jgi:adenylate cyclase